MLPGAGPNVASKVCPARMFLGLWRGRMASTTAVASSFDTPASWRTSMIVSPVLNWSVRVSLEERAGAAGELERRSSGLVERRADQAGRPNRACRRSGGRRRAGGRFGQTREKIGRDDHLLVAGLVQAGRRRRGGQGHPGDGRHDRSGHQGGGERPAAVRRAKQRDPSPGRSGAIDGGFQQMPSTERLAKGPLFLSRGPGTVPPGLPHKMCHAPAS